MAAKMRVDQALCTGCGQCVSVCPQDAIALSEGLALIDEDRCSGCGLCRQACPVGAIYPIAQGEVLVVQSQPVVVEKGRAPAALSMLRSVARSPALQALVGFVGMQVIPRVVDALVQRSQSTVEQSQVSQSPINAGAKALGSRGGRRRRHRGGRS